MSYLSDISTCGVLPTHPEHLSLPPFLAEFVSFDDLRILITHVVSSNSSYIELALKHPTKRVGLVQNRQHDHFLIETKAVSSRHDIAKSIAIRGIIGPI